MGCYKRLSPKDIKKENFYKNSKKAVVKTLKWGLISTAVLAVLGIGVFSFYSFIDKQFYKDETEGLTSATSQKPVQQVENVPVKNNSIKSDVYRTVLGSALYA